jgi:hypothetical protein
MRWSCVTTSAGVASLPERGRLRERVVGRRAPEAVRKARRQLVTRELHRRLADHLARAELDAVEELRRLQHAAQQELHAVRKPPLAAPMS